MSTTYVSQLNSSDNSLKLRLSTQAAPPITDGDYETSSEGPVRKEVARSSTNKEAFSTSSSKMVSQQDSAENPESKKDKPSEKSFGPLHSNVLTKSESMPVLKTGSSLDDTIEDTRVVSSESPLDRRRKMKMIVAQIYSRSSLASTTVSAGSGTELTKENYQAKKMESRTVLPVLQVIIS